MRVNFFLVITLWEPSAKNSRCKILNRAGASSSNSARWPVRHKNKNFSPNKMADRSCFLFSHSPWNRVARGSPDTRHGPRSWSKQFVYQSTGSRGGGLLLLSDPTTHPPIIKSTTRARLGTQKKLLGVFWAGFQCWFQFQICTARKAIVVVCCVCVHSVF